MKKELESRKQAPLSESRHIMPNNIKVTEIERQKICSSGRLRKHYSKPNLL